MGVWLQLSHVSIVTAHTQSVKSFLFDKVFHLIQDGDIVHSQEKGNSRIPFRMKWGHPLQEMNKIDVLHARRILLSILLFGAFLLAHPYVFIS